MSDVSRHTYFTYLGAKLSKLESVSGNRFCSASQNSVLPDKPQNSGPFCPCSADERILTRHLIRGYIQIHPPRPLWIFVHPPCTLWILFIFLITLLHTSNFSLPFHSLLIYLASPRPMPHPITNPRDSQTMITTLPRGQSPATIIGAGAPSRMFNAAPAGIDQCSTGGNGTPEHHSSQRQCQCLS